MPMLERGIKSYAHGKAQERRDYYRMRDAMDTYYEKYGKLPELTPKEPPALGRQLFGDLIYNTYLYYRLGYGGKIGETFEGEEK